MTRDTIQQILCHLFTRQEEHGPDSAFRFLRYQNQKKELVLAIYPKQLNNTGDGEAVDNADAGEIHRSKEKIRKGKEREVEQLDELLPMGEMAEQFPIRHDVDNAGPSKPSRIGTDLVRIGMGQMQVLRDQGFNVFGPVNGPNEGLPQYEVPKAWLQFQPAQQSSNDPSQ